MSASYQPEEDDSLAGEESKLLLDADAEGCLSLVTLNEWRRKRLVLRSCGRLPPLLPALFKAKEDEEGETGVPEDGNATKERQTLW